jgi:hypothetical protein
VGVKTAAKVLFDAQRAAEAQAAQQGGHAKACAATLLGFGVAVSLVRVKTAAEVL